MKNIFIAKYIQNLTHILNSLDTKSIENIINKLDTIDKNNGNIYVIGNGGSSATASHIANDWGMGLKLRGIRNFNIQSLGDNSAVYSAIANDIGYENVFYAQIKDVVTSKDLLIAISCSGNSKNIIKAAKYAKTQNTTVIALTGFDGGKLKDIGDIVFHIPTNKGEYGVVEDAHMILDHIIYSYYISTKPETKTKYTLE